MPRTIADVMALVRSKNAGPYWLTIDIMMGDEETYRFVKSRKVITTELIAKLYNRRKEDVIVVEHDSARAIKVSMPRAFTAGSLEDSDAHGGQQYAPLLSIELSDT